VLSVLNYGGEGGAGDMVTSAAVKIRGAFPHDVRNGDRRRHPARASRSLIGRTRRDKRPSDGPTADVNA